jgi:hypothetical protein
VVASAAKRPTARSLEAASATRSRTCNAVAPSKPANVGRFELFSSLFVVLRGPQGEPLLRTNELDGELACRATVLAIRLSAPIAARYSRRDAAQGGRYFVLHDPWGRALGFSPLFDSVDGCEEAIAATIECASEATIVRAAPTPAEFDALLPRVA